MKYIMFCLIILISLSGCVLGGNEPQPSTEILDVRVEPNPVTVGDTAIFTCIIRDSLDEELEFSWHIDGEGISNTDLNQIEWVAPLDTGVFNNSVRVIRPGNYFGAKEGFDVLVVPSKQVILEANSSTN